MHIENLSVGDYILVIADKYRPERFLPSPMSFEHEWQSPIEKRFPFPLKVLAIQSPYILCESMQKDLKGSIQVDARFEQFTKIDDLYVKEYCRINELETPDEIKTDEELENEKSLGKKLCPLCLEKLTERRVGIGDWRLTCSECQVEVVKI